MNQMSPMKLAIAGSTVVCAALLSFGWSEQRGVSLSIESAQARVGRPLTPVNGAAAVGTGAVAAGYYGNRYYGNPNNTVGLVGGDDPGTAPAARWGWGSGYSSGVWNAQASYAAPAYAAPVSASGWYLTPSGMACPSGAWIAGGDGLPFRCP